MARKPNLNKPPNPNVDHWTPHGTYVHYGKSYGLKMLPIVPGEWTIQNVLVKENELKDGEEIEN